MKHFSNTFGTRANELWIRKVMFGGTRTERGHGEALRNFVRRYKWSQSVYRAFPVKIDIERGVLKLRDADQVIYVARPVRVLKYKHGVEFRLNQIFKEYLLDDVSFAPGDVVVDIGANIGELSLALGKRFRNLKTIAIEPDPVEFGALRQNLGDNAELWDCVVWKESAILDFFLANETGDSSALPKDKNRPMVKMQAMTVDSILKNSKVSSGSKRIRLLKVEAEGAEPEVLEGASDVLSLVDYISVDCGPERGPSGESTLVAVLAFLQKHGFEPIRFGVARTVMLFRNVDCIDLQQ